jgi:uncharacterized repeat protein (TIGR03803 family)
MQEIALKQIPTGHRSLLPRAPVETVLHSFTGGSDGFFPQALYGTTYEGGTGGGYGTVFKLAPPAKARQLGQRPCSIVSKAAMALTHMPA